VSLAAIPLRVASQRVFIVVSVYFIIDSFRKLLDSTFTNLLELRLIRLAHEHDRTVLKSSFISKYVDFTERKSLCAVFNGVRVVEN
jgi:hypothetical protein